jgi:uncharacterized protein YndB with AHSA1/START domain
MNILIIILLVLAGIIALLLVIALFTRKEYVIERQITIRKPNQNVFAYIKELKNQDHYNKWVMMDPKVRKTFRGTDATIGFVSAWESDNKNVGKGEQEIKAIKEGERIDLEIRFEKPFKSVSPAYMKTEEEIGGDTTVKWGFTGKMAYPMNAMLLFINLPEMLAKDLDVSLKNLKTLLEE